MEIARHWRLNKHRYRLEGTRCERCGKKSIQQMMVCGECSIDQNSGDIYISLDPSVISKDPIENTINK